MAWTTPRTWVNGELVTASLMNTHIRDNMSDLDSRMNVARTIAGGSSIYAYFGGTLYRSETEVGSSGSSITNLATQAIAANVLSTNGHTLEIWATVSFAANSNEKRVWIYWGSYAIVAFTGFAPNDTGASLRAIITRTGASSQKAIGLLLTSTISGPVSTTYTTPTETLSGSVTLQLRAQGTDNNDIVFRSWTIGWYPVGN